MSDVSQGPGWWIASDGRWYAPELHPDYQPPQASPAQPAAGRPAEQQPTAPQFNEPQATGDQPPGPQFTEPQTTTHQLPPAAAGVFAPQPGVQQPQPAPHHSGLEGKGFVRSLYDFSFSSLITLRVIRVLYVLVTVVYSLGALITFVGLLARHTPLTIALAIIGVPLVYFIYLIVARITLEVLMVVFSMASDVRSIRERGDARAIPTAS